MRVLPIHDLDDPALADFASLTDVALRRKLEPEQGLYLAEGEKVVARALSAGHQPRSLLLQEKFLPQAERLLVGFPDVPVYVGADELIVKLTGFNVHRGVLASMHRPPLLSVTELVTQLPARARIAVLENLVDHTNVGAIFRSAAALGVDAVLITPRCADPLYRRSIKVSMGTVFQVPWTRVDPWPAGIQSLQEAGFKIAGMTLGEGAIALDELVERDPRRLALIFGSEGHGLSAATDHRVDARVTIPMMHGVDSLNVAAASAVAFYATR